MDVSIDGDRLWARLMALGDFGAREGGARESGVDRPALSEADLAAQRQVIAWGSEAGLEPSRDAAGNLFLTLPSLDPALAPLLAGSHLDTQPTGGLFDGAYGVLAALEVATAWSLAGLRPRRALRVVAWMNEEGGRFAPGMMGSETFAGTRSLDDIRAVRDADGVSVGEALDAARAALPLSPAPLGFPVHAYIEPHIEQAARLEAAGVPIGAVTGIQGKITAEGVIVGREAHAGTEPMAARLDALQAFARGALRLHEEVGAHDGEVRLTIGRLLIEPNAPSVVPARATFRLDLRHPDGPTLAALGARLEPLLREAAAPCEARLTRLVDAPPNAFDEGLIAATLAAAGARGVRAMPLLSSAGHDARHLAGVTRTAMIFVPCRGGVSHSPEEWAEPSHLAVGAAVLADLLATLAEPAEDLSP